MAMDDDDRNGSSSGSENKAGVTAGEAIDPGAADAAEMAEAKRNRPWSEIGPGAAVVVDFTTRTTPNHQATGGADRNGLTCSSWCGRLRT